MNEIQERIDALTYINNLSEEIQNDLFDLMSWAAELCNEYNKITDHGKRSFVVNRNFEKQIGKTIYSLVRVANSAGIDLTSALDETLKT